MIEAERELASSCYGYGRWGAPYWFIGPEQGQAKRELDNLTTRGEAFQRHAKEGLSDCKDFHSAIGEERWHRNKPALQSTWRPLMLLLMSYLDQLTGDKFQDGVLLRNYQRDKWASANGDTCVIELAGLPANSSKTDRDRDTFRADRMAFILKKMLAAQPEFVIIYGNKQKEHWTSLCRLPSNVTFTQHPVAYGSKNTFWIELGQSLRIAPLRHISRKLIPRT